MTRKILFPNTQPAQPKAQRQPKKKQKPARKGPAAVTNVSVARGISAKASQPSIVNGAGTVRVSHREFVGSVTNGAVTGFALTALSSATPGYDLNPACSILFPWLSNLAPSFERYRFLNMTFRFVPSSPTTTAGRFYAAVDYDYDDPVATSKQQLMTNTTAVEVPVWMETALVVKSNELHRDQPYKYVTATSRNNFIEPRTAYCGYLMCGYDTPTANLLYDLWVEYTVEFQLPVADAPVQLVALPVTSAVADLANLGGGATKWGLANIVPIVGAALKVVAPGNSITPILDLLPIAGVSLRPTTAYDIRGCRAKSVLQMIGEYFETGETPAAVLAHNAGLPVYAFDDKGTYLGGVTPTTSLYGPKTPTSIVVGSDPVKAVVDFHIDEVWAQFRTAAYLAVAIASTGALGAGGIGIGTKFDF